MYYNLSYSSKGNEKQIHCRKIPPFLLSTEKTSKHRKYKTKVKQIESPDGDHELV